MRLYCSLGNVYQSPSEWKNLDLTTIGKLHNKKPDLEKFPCIRLAFEALEKGGTATVVLNVANDTAVASFLNGHISFIDIPPLIEGAINQHEWSPSPDLNTIFKISNWTSQYIHNQIKAYA